MKRPLIIIILLTLFFLLCKFSHASTLDLPGNAEVSYDQRMTNKVENADNATGRQQIYIEQGFTDTRISKIISGYVGYRLYAPNETPTDNHVLFGLRNKSLLPPFNLALEFQHPVHQSSDPYNAIVFSVSYGRDWNLIKDRRDKDE